MIDAAHEDLIPLGDVPLELPHRRGKPVHISTIFRWTLRGCKGVRLEWLQVGGVKCTSRQALQRFFDALTPSSAAPQSSTPAARRRAIAAAERELEQAGL